MPQKHQLAAILFADVVGYTAMMQSDEQKAIIQLEKFKITLELQVAKELQTIVSPEIRNRINQIPTNYLDRMELLD